MKFFKNKKGFTLVELVVVIAILGILAGIAIPRFMDATASARGAKVVADMRTIESSLSMYYAKKGSYYSSGTTAVTIPNLVSDGYLASEPKPPTGTMIVDGSSTYTSTAAASVPGNSYGISVTNSGTNASVTLGSATLNTIYGS